MLTNIQIGLINVKQNVSLFQFEVWKISIPFKNKGLLKFLLLLKNEQALKIIT